VREVGGVVDANRGPYLDPWMVRGAPLPPGGSVTRLGHRSGPVFGYPARFWAAETGRQV